MMIKTVRTSLNGCQLSSQKQKLNAAHGHFCQITPIFLLRSGPKGITTLMRRLPTGYAVSYNRRHKRHGQQLHNMPGRFLFTGISTYIHLNTLRAKALIDLKGRFINWKFELF